MGDEDLRNMIEFKDNDNEPDRTDISAKRQAFKCYWALGYGLAINDGVFKNSLVECGW